MAGQLRSYGDLVNNLFNSSSNFLSTRFDQLNHDIEQQAQFDLIEFRNSLKEKRAMFQMKAAEMSNPEDIQREFEAWNKENFDALSDDTDGNPMFARNAYTARLFKKELSDNQTDMQIALTQRAWENQRAKNLETCTNQIMNNRDLKDPGQVLQANESVYQKMKDSNLLSEQQINQLRTREQNNLLMAQSAEAYRKILMEKPNANLNEIVAKAKEQGKNAVFETGLANMVMTEEEKEAALEQGVKMAQMEIKQTQDHNNDFIFKQNSAIRNNLMMGKGSQQEMLAQIDRQINNIKRYNNAQLNVGDQRSRVEELMALRDTVMKGDRVASARAGAQAQIKVDMDEYIEAAWRGKENELAPGYTSFDAARDAFKQELIEAGQYDEKTWPSLAAQFVDKAKAKIKARDPSLAKAIDDLADVSKLLEKGVGKDLYKMDPNFKGEMTRLVGLELWDYYMNDCQSGVTSEDIEHKAKEIKNKIVSKEFLRLKQEKLKPEEIQKMMDKDMAFTDAYGRVQYTGGNATKKMIEEQTKLEKNDLARYFGVKPGQIKD
ncbi:MAG: hypothetical protein MJ052_01465 [Sphaerochaetaceae bacterium]|nr:hypothetical protein [Sphaerochaetaceae bacterium]